VVAKRFIKKRTSFTKARKETYLEFTR